VRIREIHGKEFDRAFALQTYARGPIYKLEAGGAFVDAEVEKSLPKVKAPESLTTLRGFCDSI
jgi:hypothetical protein